MKREDEGIHWVGMDVSKGSFEVALARPGQRFPSTPLRDLPWKRFPRTEAGVAQFLAWLDRLTAGTEDPRVRVVMEATGDYSVALAAWLLKCRPALAPAIAPPAQTKAFLDSLGQRNKTDGLDARGLAFYGVERRPSPYAPLTPERQELRTLMRYRDALVKERTALKNRMQERCSSRLVRTMQARRRKQLDRDIDKLEAESKRVIREAPCLKADYVLLRSIAGVGHITAAIVLAELGDLRRFQRARQLTAYVGVHPSIHESGERVRRKSKMSKRGNGRVRRVLYLSGMAVLRTKKEHPLKTLHRRLCADGKTGISALGVVMRKQLVLMRAVVISGKPYDHLWKTRARTPSLIPN